MSTTFNTSADAITANVVYTMYDDDVIRKEYKLNLLRPQLRLTLVQNITDYKCPYVKAKLFVIFVYWLILNRNLYSLEKVIEVILVSVIKYSVIFIEYMKIFISYVIG